MLYLIRCSLFAGTVGALVGIMQLLSFSSVEIHPLMAGLSVAICPLFYAFVIAIVLLPIEAKLELKISEFMENE